MELKYLQTFRTIIETGSFLNAARRLNYTQSTITFQMQQLEQELSVKLFEKIGRKMVLTQAGHELLPYVDTVLQSVEQLKNYGRDYMKLSGTLKVAVPETLLTYQMQPVLQEFRKRAPGVKLSVQCLNCYHIRDELVDGKIDLGVHYNVAGAADSLTVKPLAEFSLAVIASPALSEDICDLITPGRRNTVPVITNDDQSIYQRMLDQYLSEKQIIMETVMNLGSVETVKGCVSSNLGIALLPRYTVEKEMRQGTLRELKVPELTDKKLTAVCTCHKNKWITPAMELFIELIQRRFEGMSESN